jgi:hypothetical protein
MGDPYRQLRRRFYETIVHLTPHEQLEALQRFTAASLNILSSEAIRALRCELAKDAGRAPCPCCGEDPGTLMLELIDGHLALRQMKLIPEPPGE